MDKCLPDELLLRISSLRHSLTDDVNRPYWQVEFSNIILEMTLLLGLIRSDAVAASVSIKALDKKVSSLEQRYSELLYRMSDRS